MDSLYGLEVKIVFRTIFDETIECPDQYLNKVLLPKMKKYIAQERMYGNIKDSAWEK